MHGGGFEALQNAMDIASPPESLFRLQSCSMSFFDLISEQGVETLHYSLRGAALHNLPDFVGEANGDELL